MATFRNILFPLAVVLAVAALAARAARSPTGDVPSGPSPALDADLQPTVDRIDGFFEDHWQTAAVQPTKAADELQVLRRLSLALHGATPSLEEIRQFEADGGPDRLQRWTSRILADSRFADYFAERLARVFVGTEGGQAFIYRRDRFVAWLGEQLRQRRRYDEIVRQLISDPGLWTDAPAVNFVTAAAVEGDVDEAKLAGRVVRAFLGQRIDCAQCHDHPFADWIQADFEGIAAHFGQARLSVVGVEDDRRRSFQLDDGAMSAKPRSVTPRVPFHDEWLPADGTLRTRLAAWVTHPENRRFERAIANRVWGLMFGRPYVTPVDDLPDPAGKHDLLDMLGSDFRAHGYDLRRMIQVIAASRVFRLASTHALEGDAGDLDQQWAVFPLTRLRPEQVIGAMLQASSLKTIDLNSHLFTRAIRFFQEKDFVNEYGDLGQDELEEHAGTVPQALLRLNGRFAEERSAAKLFSAAGRIAQVAATDADCLETCYLVCLTRRPTEGERSHFLAQFQTAGETERSRLVEDLFWTLFNSPEFAWSH